MSDSVQHARTVVGLWNEGLRDDALGALERLMARGDWVSALTSIKPPSELMACLEITRLDGGMCSVRIVRRGPTA